ncbi:MAG: hypothetical protein Kow0010_14690 [Dehalococcoidia bacterium]
MFLFRSRNSSNQIRDLIRRGVGLREHSWATPDLTTSDARDRLAADVLAFVRESMASMRRPHGIDHVALALSVQGDDGRVLCSSSLGVVRPLDFYRDEGAAGIRAFIDDAASLSRTGPIEVTAALVCLGDIAFALAGTPAA